MIDEKVTQEADRFHSVDDTLASKATPMPEPSQPAEQEKIVLESEKSYEEIREKIKKYENTVKPVFKSACFFKETDKGNDLLWNIDRLWERMGNVFPEYKTVDSDNLLTYITSKIGSKHKVQWSDDDYKCLMIDGAKTRIKYEDVKLAYAGLKNIASPKQADILVGKLIVSKLKKLF